MTREFVSGNGGKVSAMALVCAGFFSFFKGGGGGGSEVRCSKCRDASLLACFKVVMMMRLFLSLCVCYDDEGRKIQGCFFSLLDWNTGIRLFLGGLFNIRF